MKTLLLIILSALLTVWPANASSSSNESGIWVIVTLVVAAMSILGNFISVFLQARATRSETSKTLENEAAKLLIPKRQQMNACLKRLKHYADCLGIDLTEYFSYYCGTEKRRSLSQPEFEGFVELTDMILMDLEKAIRHSTQWRYDDEFERMIDKCMTVIIKIQHLARLRQFDVTTSQLESYGIKCLTVELPQALESGSGATLILPAKGRDK